MALAGVLLASLVASVLATGATEQSWTQYFSSCTPAIASLLDSATLYEVNLPQNEISVVKKSVKTWQIFSTMNSSPRQCDIRRQQFARAEQRGVARFR